MEKESKKGKVFAYRYVAAIRKADVSFGYMDGEVNIEKNIVQI